MKAVFKLTMVVPQDMNAISNTRPDTGYPIESLIEGKTRNTYVFAETPKMSTYLLAFIVSKYVAKINDAGNFGVYARPAATEQTTLALSFGVDMLKRLGEYVGIDYYSVDKVTKMDMAVS